MSRDFAITDTSRQTTDDCQLTTVLHVDTSTDVGTVFLSAGGKVLTGRDTVIARNHAASVNGMIAEVLAEAGRKINDIGSIAVCAGPGSYTGLRIGMATAKGICYATGCNLMTHNRLTLLAYQAYKTNPGYSSYVVLITARIKEYFLAVYDGNFNCNIAPIHVSEQEAAGYLQGRDNTYFITDASEDFVKTLGAVVVDNNLTISKIQWAEYAGTRAVCNEFVTLWVAEPFYLKDVYTHK